MEENRLFGRQVPLVAKALAAVARAEFPEGSTRRNQPTLYDLLKEPVSQEALPIDAAEFPRLEDMPPSLLEAPKGPQRPSEILVLRGRSLILPQPYFCKSIMPKQYKFIMYY